MRHLYFVLITHSSRSQTFLWQRFLNICAATVLMWGLVASPLAIATPLNTSGQPPSQPERIPESVPESVDELAAFDLQQGKQLFQQSCSVCHINGQNLIVNSKTLEYPALKHYGMDSLEAITRQITYGKNVMPAFGDALHPDQIHNIAAYVLQQSKDGW